MADDAVVAAAKRGESEAWRVLYREHAGRLVVWLSTRPTGDSVASPEDMAAEAWLVAARKVAEFEGSSSDFGGWLFGIARRISANSRRTAQRRNTRPCDLDEVVETVPDHADRLAGQDWVRTMLEALSPRERAAVGLVDGLGMDTKTAAEILSISPVALRVARHRGLRRLSGRERSVPAFDPFREAAPGI